MLNFLYSQHKKWNDLKSCLDTKNDKNDALWYLSFLSNKIVNKRVSLSFIFFTMFCHETWRNACSDISLVNAATFVWVCKLEGSTKYQLQLHPSNSVKARSSSTSTPPVLDTVPPEYCNYADVFSKAKASELVTVQLFILSNLWLDSILSYRSVQPYLIYLSLDPYLMLYTLPPLMSFRIALAPLWHH